MLFNFFSRVIPSCACVSWGVFVPLNEIVLFCIFEVLFKNLRSLVGFNGSGQLCNKYQQRAEEIN